MPVITWLSPNGRIELSGKTFQNGISKAANYLVDGCGFDDSSEIRVELENHWQAPVWKLAALVAGIGLSDTSDNVFAFVDNDEFANKFVVSRDPFGMPVRDLPAGIENVSLEVRSHGDYFAPQYSLGQSAVTFAGQSLTESELLDQVSSRAKIGRYGLVVNNNNLDALVLQALIPALTDSSVVLIDGIDPTDSSVAAEKIQEIITV